MEKKKFIVVVLDLEHETYIVHIASLNSIPRNVNLSQRPQISGSIAKKALTKVSNKYADFADICSSDLVSKLSEYTGINDYTIKLVNGQQPLYGAIYSLGPVETETMKAYIKINLANGFIRPSKSPASSPILFDRMSDGFLRLCVDYQGFNNLMIKNQYLLPLIEKLLDRLGRARRFTQLDFTSAYHQMRICKGDK